MAHQVTSNCTPSIQEPAPRVASNQPLSPAPSDHNSSASEEEFAQNQTLSRPKLQSRKSSGSMIVTRNSPTVISDQEYDEDDVRSMSPRRNSTEVDRLSEAARQDLRDQARVLQMSLQDIVDKIERVKTEQEKLEAGNKFLQSYACY
jgi:hypothetical protein